MNLKAAAIGLGLILAILAGLAGYNSCRKTQGSAAEVQANIAKGEANAHQSQAQASDAVVSDLQAKHLETKKALDRLTNERVALLKRLDVERQARLDAESAHPATIEPIPDVRDAVIAKDAEVIAALQADSTVKDSLIVQLTASRDEWKQTAEARERQALAQESATKAWKHAVTSSRWQGRIEGFAAGAALGFLGGRR